MQRVLTGLQPSGKLHIGNYFGSIKQMLDLQNEENDLIVFIANYHALTTTKDKDLLKKNTIECFKDLIALGIDPNKTTLFIQSDVPEVLELNLILNNLTPLSYLERCHAFKDKVNKGIGVNNGLFSYPVLMAADILLYNADIIPIGKDQIQHVELTKDIAIKFNETYGKKSLKLPEFKIEENGSLIRGIDKQKMSKSYNNTIPIFGDRKEISKIVTSSAGINDIKPLDCVIYELAKLFMDDVRFAELEYFYKVPGFGYGDFKRLLKESINQYFKEATEKRNSITNIQIEEFRELGKEKAKLIAKENLSIIKDKVGL